LQERRFRRVGGTDELEADIRVIAATNRDLGRAVADGRFREDLYYRLNVISVRLLPLRERREDIPLLAQHFVGKYARQMGKPVRGLSPAALASLERHQWPGNIRELENAIERATALEQTGTIQEESLPEHVRRAGDPAFEGTGPGEHGLKTSPRLPEAGINLEAHVASIERELIAQALDRADGVKTRAAELLGMSFRSFRYYAKKYQLG